MYSKNNVIMQSNKTPNHQIIKDKYTYSKIKETNKTSKNFVYMEVPTEMMIIDSRTTQDFKKHTFGGYSRSQVLSALDKEISSEKLDVSVYWGIQLLLSGIVMGLWDKLYVIACKKVNIHNPTLPTLLWNRYQKWEKIATDPSFTKQNCLMLRNHPEIRNYLAEMVSVITLSRKRKLETLPKIKKTDFIVQNFKSKLEADDTLLTAKIFQENDPSEVRIAANEFAYHLRNRNTGKALYWLSWMIEWDKLNHKQYGKFEVSTRSVLGIDSKYHRNIVWLFWEIINTLRRVSYNFDDSVGCNENTQIDALWELYKWKFTPGHRCRKVFYIIWAIKYMTTKIDWKIKIVDREYLLFQAMSNINVMFRNIKSQEVKKDAYQNQKFNVVVRNNYMITQRHQEIEAIKQEKQLQKEKEQRIKEAKKKKVSVQSLNKMDALNMIDKMRMN